MKFLDIAGLRKFLALLLTKVVAAINDVANKVTNIEGDYLSKSNGGTVDGETHFNGKTHFAENVFLNDNLDAGNHDIKNVKNLYVAQSLHSEKNLYTGKIQPNADNTYLIGDANIAYKKGYINQIISDLTGASGIIEALNSGSNTEVVFLKGPVDYADGSYSANMNIGIYENKLMAKFKYATSSRPKGTEEDLVLLDTSANSSFPGNVTINKALSVENGYLTVKNTQTWNKTSDPTDPNAPINSLKVRDNRIDIFKEEGTGGVSNITIPFSRKDNIRIRQGVDLGTLNSDIVNNEGPLTTADLIVKNSVTLGELGGISFEDTGGESTTGSFNFAYQDADYAIGGTNSDITFSSPDSFTIDIDGKKEVEINYDRVKLRLDDNNSFYIEQGNIVANTEIFKLNGTADSPNGGLFQTRLQMSYNQRDIWELQEAGRALYIRYEDSTLSSPSFKTLFSITSDGNVQLGTQTIGSNTQPIYLNAGKPTVCTAVKAAIADKANAVDWANVSNKPTIPAYGAATQSAAGLMSAADKKKVDNMVDFVELTAAQLTSLTT